MSRPKWNKHPWYTLGLALLLCVAALVAATGTTLARYQAQRSQILTFQVRSPAQIHLGVVETTEKEDGTTVTAFKATESLEWDEETAGELYLLELAIANGTSETSFSDKPQTVNFRLYCSIGMTEGTNISLRIPQEDGYKTVPGIVREITEGSSLYVTDGSGYIYTFHEQEDGSEEPGEELTWQLPGGTFLYIPLTVVMEGKLPDYETLIRPQLVANLTK